MQIALVRRGYSATGGAEKYLLRLARALADGGWEPRLVTTRHWPPDRWPYGPATRLAGGSPKRFARELDALERSWDVLFSLERVHGCDIYRAGDGVHAAWLRRRAPYEAGWRRWARLANPKHRQLLELERSVCNPGRTRLLIANSAMVRDEIAEYHRFPIERIRIVRNGVDPIACDPAAARALRQQLGIAEDETAAAFVGSGWDRKGLRFAVEAAARIPRMRLVVAGRGKAGAAAQPHVRILGPVHDASAVLCAADLFVLPTIYDPFSNACLEAFAAGCPVVTTIANGFSELIEPGVTGETVPPGEVDALQAALEKWSSRERCAAASDRCRAVAAEHSTDANAARTIDVVLEAIRA